MIGCGNFYNQEREKVWCPWTQHPNLVDKYIVHVIGDPDAEADYTHLDDFANFLVATLLKPQKSENQYLNVVSDTISHAKIVGLLRMYTGKEVQLDVQSVEAMHKSAFPVDFWYLVKGLQGLGESVRPKSQIHNDLFEGVRYTPFEWYFKQRFGKGEKL
ncbi:NAD-binding protein [Pyrenophora tritici-repentis]|nr:NAD-binding protein [Pyrenophora tritici-repentis]